jgi:hypothetical protein
LQIRILFFTGVGEEEGGFDADDAAVAYCCNEPPPSPLLLPSMSMPQIQTFPETMMFTDFTESSLVLKARPT